MDSVFSITQIVTNIKEDGLPISAMDRELSGLQILKINFVDNTQEIGRMILSKEEEPCSIKKEIDMTECGWTIFLTVKEE